MRPEPSEEGAGIFFASTPSVVKLETKGKLEAKGERRRPPIVIALIPTPKAKNGIYGKPDVDKIPAMDKMPAMPFQKTRKKKIGNGTMIIMVL